MEKGAQQVLSEPPVLLATTLTVEGEPTDLDPGGRLSAPLSHESLGILPVALQADPREATQFAAPAPKADTPNGLASNKPPTLSSPSPAFIPAPSLRNLPATHVDGDTPAPSGPDGGSAKSIPSSTQADSSADLGAHAAAAIAAMEATLDAPLAAPGSEDVAADGGAGPEGSAEEAPVFPLLVFINSKSGGRLGPTLLTGFQKLISKSQVFDLSVESPGPVLAALMKRLDAQCIAGSSAAIATRAAMRILVCGGDGTVGWVLASLEALHLERPPPVGVVPLGTGNDLARTFGWGATFSSAQLARLPKYVARVAAATPSLMDNWQVELFPADSAPLALPHALHPHQLRPTTHLLPSSHHGLTARPGYRGGFWNYFSLGMDAHTAYAFHHLRERKPWLARGRRVNQALYGYYGCAQGWFCLPCACSTPHEVAAVARVQYCGTDGVWHPLALPSNICAVVVLNLQSYAGGRDPWGHPSRRIQQKEGFVDAAVDDGLLEVVALRGGWHTAAVMAQASTARRLVQARSLVVELHGERAPRAYMQLDGEPWVQPCDPTKEPAVLHITHSGQSVVLATKESKVRSSTLGQRETHPATPPAPPAKVVEAANGGQRGRQEGTTEIELVQQEGEAELGRVKRKH